jgi:sporulation protein YlmC with PRC-barrel domain
MKRMYLLLLLVLMSTALVFAQDAQTMPETETEQPGATDQNGELGAGEGEEVPEAPEPVPELEPTVPETEPAVPETEPTVPGTEPAVPETPETMPEGGEELGAGEMPQEVSFSDVQGYSIQSVDGTIQGNVADAVIAQDGTVAYVVVELSAPAEFAGNRYLVPPVVAQLDAAQGLGTFDIQTADIAGLPPLDAETLGAGGIGPDVHTYWQERLGASFTPPDVESAALISEIMNFQVVGADQQQMGTISDIMIDLSTQQIASFSVSGDEALGAGEQTVDLEQAEIDTQAQTITVQETGAAEDTLGTGEPAAPEAMPGPEAEPLPEPEETAPDATVPEPTVPEAEPPVPETDGTLGAGEPTEPETVPAPDTGEGDTSY